MAGINPLQSSWIANKPAIPIQSFRWLQTRYDDFISHLRAGLPQKSESGMFLHFPDYPDKF